MLLKMGVDISRLERPMRKGLNKIEHVSLREVNEESVVTSTYEGLHSPSSLHYANLAVDIRIPRKLLLCEQKEFVAALKAELGNNFDVILEKDHIHIEYDI